MPPYNVIIADDGDTQLKAGWSNVREATAKDWNKEIKTPGKKFNDIPTAVLIYVSFPIFYKLKHENRMKYWLIFVEEFILCTADITKYNVYLTYHCVVLSQL